MTNPALWVGVAATLAIVWQNQSALLAFGWAAIHGVGAEALVAFGPAAIALAGLWGCYLWIRRDPHRPRAASVFGACALLILALNEGVLPGTPLTTSRDQRALAGVKVGNVRDEVALTAAGRPTGLRIRFDATFPRAGSYTVAPAAPQPLTGSLPWALQLTSMRMPVIKPSPEEGQGLDATFRAGKTYAFTYDLLPTFVLYDATTNKTCLNFTPTNMFSEADFLEALARSRSVRFRVAIQADRVGSLSTRVVAGEFVTGVYDLEAIYLAMAAEGVRHCPL